MNLKSLFKSFILSICLLTSTISLGQLSGAYTIGAGGDYTTWTEAVDTLVSQGVSGPVIMNVFNGIYVEQITIPAITGASLTNTVTFQSNSLDSSAVTLRFSSTLADNYVVRLNAANFINFNQVSIVSTGTTYSRCVYLLGGASNNTFSNCELSGPSGNLTSTNNAIIYSYGTQDENNVIQNNLLVNGSYGIYLRGTSTSVLAAGNVIQNNLLVDNYYYGIALRHQDSPVISGNNIIMSASSSSGSGIYTNYSDYSMLIEKNTISMTNGGYGIYVNNSDGSFSLKAEISNNMIYVGGTATSYGIYSNASTYQNIFHNSVNVLGNSSSGRAFTAAGGNNLDVRNNCFKNSNWGFAYHTNSVSNITTSDNNNLYSTGNYLAYWNANYEDLPALQAGSGKDANSVSVHPNYTSTTDLHTNIYTLESMGDGTVGITTDIDGDARSGSPDIGADEFTGVGTPLAGTYTIGGTTPTPSFTTISDAVDSMNIVGISASVIFDIRDGSYSEQFQVMPITGSSMSNTVIFQSENRDSSLVDINFAASSSSYVFRLRGADYVTIRDLAISATGTTNGVAIRLSGNPKWDSIYNCEITGNTSVTGDGSIHGNESLFNHIVVQNNNFSSGYYGIRMDNADAVYAAGINVSGNVFSDQYAISIYMEDMDAAVVMNNTISVTGYSSYYGINLVDVNNDFVLTGNYVSSIDGTSGGLRIDNCTGTSSKRGLVANNVVVSGGTSYAFGIYTRYSDYVNVYYNSTRISSSNYTLGIGYYNFNGNNVDVQNNVFTNFGGGYAYYTNNATAVTNSDYNNIFTTGNFVGAWNAIAKSDLSAFQSASTMDANSISVNPVFVSSTDLHATSSFVNDLGTPLASVTIDIDGEARSGTNPDMGADEFTPDTAMTPLIGVYTIGGTTPDYTDFTAAVDDLNLRGIAGVVTFNARPGTYSEQVKILPISGSSATDTVVFQSESGDSSTVVMTYSATASTDNYVFRLQGASYVTIQKMTLAATSNTYCRVIHINGAVNNLNIRNNILSGTANPTSSIVYAYDDILSDIRITNNFISEGNYGVYINGDNNLHSTGIVVNNNIITSTKAGAMRLEDCSAPIIMGNDCSNSGNNYYGIYLNGCDGKFQIIGNKVVSSDYYHGIYIYLCNGSAPFRGLIANNFCSIGGASSAYGIRLYNSSFVNVYHNNVNLTSTGTGARAFYLSNGGSDINIKNNNFINTGPGYAYYVSTTTAVSSSDFNNLQSAGTNIAYWGANTATLADLQTASSMEASSISVSPMYASTTDLHVGAVALMGAATPVGILDDFDGQTRDGVTPDIGADEFFCTTPTFSVTLTSPCLGDSTFFMDNSTIIEPGSTYDWDFDGDLVADYSSITGGETIGYLFGTAGSHTVTLIISQIAGCVDTLTMNAVVNTFPVLSLSSTGVYCDSANGTASVTATSGTSPYTYSWSNGGTTTTITALDIGLYTIAVTDINNCTSLDTVSVNESMVVTVTELSPSTCGNADGVATVSSVSGGFPPYDYVWSSGDTTVTDSSLTSGIQYVSVIDVNGCVAYATINISDSDTGPSIGLQSQTNNICSGDQLGAVDIFVLGGTTPYTVMWSNGETTQDVDSLGEGIYEVSITDADGCVATESYTITTPDPLTSTTVVSDASCGINDGSAVIVVNGGTLSYTYNWTSGGTNQIETGLQAGIYAVTITDGNGCILIAPVIVSNVGAPTVVVVSTTDVDCNNPTVGAIDISVSGGASPYTYLWSNTDTSEDVANLALGTYNVTVTDGNGCQGAQIAEINEKIPDIQDICVVTVDTISGMNLIVWEKTPGLNIDYFNIYKEGTQSGIYFLVGSRPFDSISVFEDSLANPQIRSWRYKISAVDSCGQESDLSGIHKTMHLTVNLGLNNTINLIWDDYSGFSFSSYIIYRGTDPDSMVAYDVIPSNLHSYVDPAPPTGQLYYLVSALHPSGGCTADKTKNFNSAKSNTTSIGSATANPLSLGLSSTPATFQACDGTAIATVTGGTGPYTYDWNTTPAQTSDTAIGLCPGNYNVLVTDNNGDTISGNVSVVELTSIQENLFEESFVVFPNPNRGQFDVFVELNHKSDLTIELFDMKGQLILKNTSVDLTGPFSKSIDLSDSNSGIYHLKLTSNTNIVHRKIVVQ